MEIQKNSALLVNFSDPKSLNNLLAQLKPGYTLDAVVTAKLAEDSFALKLSGGQLLRAQTPNVLEIGQILRLEVVKTGTVPELKIIVPQQRTVQPEQAVVAQALRQFLPKQQSLTDFAVSLRQVAALTSGKSDAVSVAIHEVLGSLLSKDELISAEGLKRGISNSGVFLEAKLASPPLTLQGDLKGRLLTLADTLQKVMGNQGNASSAEASHPEAAKPANLPLPLQGDLKGPLLTLADTLQKVMGNQGSASSAETSHPEAARLVDAASAKIVLDVLEEAVDKMVFNKDPGDFLAAKPANLPLPLQGNLKEQLQTLAEALQKGNQSIGTSPPKTAQATDSESAKSLLDVLAGSMDKTLLNKTEGAIARIVLDQLASLPQTEGKQNVWQIEIPFIDGRHTDSVKLKINHESNTGQASDQPDWTVVLELNPPGLGTLHCRISLVGDVIDTYFWSDRQAVTTLVREHLDLLSSRYTLAGLAVGQLNALEGAPVNSQTFAASVPPALVDERI